AQIRAGAARLSADLRAEPTFVARYYLGMALLNLGRAAEALPQFRAAQRFKPNDTRLVGQLVQLEAAVVEAAAARKAARLPVAKLAAPADGPRPSVLVEDGSPAVRPL